MLRQKTKATVEREFEVIGYDIVEDEIVWNSVKTDIPLLLTQLNLLMHNS